MNTYSLSQAQFQAAAALSVSGLFDVKTYLAANPDVAASNTDPIWHYVTYGIYEGRIPSGIADNVPLVESLVLMHVLCPYDTMTAADTSMSAFRDYLLDDDVALYGTNCMGEKLTKLLRTAIILMQHNSLPPHDNDQSLKLTSANPNTVSVTFPKWMRNATGQGCQIESDALKLDCIFTCLHSGELKLTFRGNALQSKDTADQEPLLKTQYLQVKILRNGNIEADTQKPFVANPDHAYVLTVHVNQNDAISLQAQWAPCFHDRMALFAILKSIDDRVARLADFL